MLTLVRRRTLAQWRLLEGIVALVTLGTALLGVGALLMGPTQDRSFTAGVEETTPQQTAVTAFIGGVKASDAVAVRDAARAVIADALRPLDPTFTSSATSRMRRLGDGQRLGYLVSTTSLPERAALTSGRWADGAGETVVPEAAASRLHLAVGDRISVGREIGTRPVENSVSLVVVGIFRAASRTGWERDPLAGSGYDAAYTDGSLPRLSPTYGPFVVDDATFLATGSTIDALQVTGNPTLTRATNQSMNAAVGALRSADGLLSAQVVDQVDISRVASDLPETLSQVHAQQAATRSTLLVVLLLGTVMALTALLLAGRLLGDVRASERALLADLGLGRDQLVVSTLAEVLFIAGAATVLAVPVAALVHSAVTHLPALAAAGLSQRPAVTPGLVLVEVASAILLALALVIPMVGTARLGSRAARAAQSGVDLLLGVVAIAAWWQLHSQPPTATTDDATLILAPVVCVVAVTVLAVRWAPVLLAAVAWAASRSTALVLPLATSQAARRPYGGAALALLAMATASATFGLALQTTWDRSQDDQAALRVGTDLSFALSTPATDREAAAIAAATRGLATSAVIDRPLALGQYVGSGEDDSAPVLVAADSRRAGTLLRGRLDQGRTWTTIGDLLAPGPAVVGLPLSTGGVTVKGSAPRGVPIEVTPTLLVQDASGFRRSVSADAVPLDGRSHVLAGTGHLEGAHLVAAQLTLSGRTTPGATSVTVDLSVRTPDAGAVRDWHVEKLGAPDTPVTGAAASVTSSAGATTVRTTVQLDLGFLAYADGDVLVTGFKRPAALPVAVSERLADVVGTKVGGTISATVEGVPVPLQIVAVIPTVPSAPGRVAVLADADTLSRILIGLGHLEPVVDAWWVADPAPKTARDLTRLDLGEVTTRTGVAAQLEQGPLRAMVPAALVLLVVAAGLLLLAGAALVVGADRPARSAEVARLRALGLTRRQVTRLVLVEHGILLGLVVVTGAAVGVVASVALGPSLVRSDVGVAPVPAAVLVWPWGRESAVVVGALVGCLLIATVITFVVVRRSGPEQLRAADS
ncbi:permease [Aeromicrobium ginsengisoli]|uniref:Permease n=1 Tax=Aeromicrobium ginsengisoli TaxID=363867 RepID=A0A5M4FDE4_9ACTN|nr:permease [Aeromicrobium ginsengisoli]KAA1397259.1 permease [Aeromicrobium ginsengisoli]